MTSPFAALNHSLERLKMSVQMRKRQRRDWMQRLMKDTISYGDTLTQERGKPQKRAASSELKLVPIDTADDNNANVTRSCEIEQGATNAGMRAASKQASDSNTIHLH